MGDIENRDIEVGVTGDNKVRVTMGPHILTMSPSHARWLAHHMSAAAYLIDPVDDDEEEVKPSSPEKV